MADIRRTYASKTVTILAGSSLASEPVDMRRVSDGMVLSPSAMTAGWGHPQALTTALSSGT